MTRKYTWFRINGFFITIYTIFGCSIEAEAKNHALFHKAMKPFTQIVLLVTCIFDIRSAIADLTFGELYARDHSCFYFPDA